jgi:hypothetical protein
VVSDRSSESALKYSTSSPKMKKNESN